MRLSTEIKTLRLTVMALACLAGLLLALPTGSQAADPAPTPAPSRIVLNPTVHPESSQTVTWRTDAATTDGWAEIQPAAGGPASTLAATNKDPVTLTGWTYTSRHHTVTFTGLEPDTAYRYRVGNGTDWSNWFNFTTATKGLTKPWRMVFFGDAQIDLDTVWPQMVARAFEAAPDARAAVSVGDMVDQGSDDLQWNDWFAGLGSHAMEANQIPVVGNHELQGDIELKQYRSHFTNAGNGPEGTDVFHTYYEPGATLSFTDYQGVRIISLDGNDMFPERQLAFLESALKNNPNRWTVLAIHEPFISNEPGGASPFFKRDEFMPLIRKYSPDLVLQGHNHSYARGYLNSFTRPDGNPSGPIFVSAVSGPKRTAASSGPPDDWSALDATRVKSYQYTGTVQDIKFEKDRILFRSHIAYKGSGSDATGEVGDLADQFTILRDPKGGNYMVEGDEPAPAQVGARRLKVLKVTLNRQRGTALVRVRLPAAGQLRVTGKLKRGRLKLRPVSRRAASAKTVIVPLKPKRRIARGRSAATVRFTFKPKVGKTQNVKRKITLIRR